MEIDVLELIRSVLEYWFLILFWVAKYLKSISDTVVRTLSTHHDRILRLEIKHELEEELKAKAL